MTTHPRGPDKRARGYRRSGPPLGASLRDDSRVTPVQVAARQHQRRVHHPPEVQSRRQTLLRGPIEPGQYVSLAFGRAAHQAGIAVSMGSRGDAYDCEDVQAIGLA
jgi:hypothetical protein